MAKIDPAILAHLEWLGFVQPTGLVVSAPALVRAGAILDRRDATGQRLLISCTEERTIDPKEGPVAWLPDFRVFAETVLGWSFSPKAYAGMDDCPIQAELEVPLADYGVTLRPDFAVRELEPQDGDIPWQLLVRVLASEQAFDQPVRGDGQLEASAHGRMERLLRQTGVTAGLLFNGHALRLISAPRGESSGWLEFRVADMVQVAGRPISTALRLLLSERRLLSLPRHQRLTALLDDSRKYQNEVSERLAEQVLHALYEFLRGFQAAHDASKCELLHQPLDEQPDEVYRALLTVILRLVFLLYAEERDMLPEDETFLRYYSLAGLFERLREDAALYPDTMNQRYGAWAQLLVLFRLIHDGADAGAMRLPRRHGSLFDPDRFPFLEGRLTGSARQTHESIEPPLVPDGTIYRALEKLLVLDGERISYRALDVEQIGSVYQTMMGFRLETTTGRSVAIKAQKKWGAPAAIDLETLLEVPSGKRAKWIQDRADRKLSDKVKKAVVEASTLEELHVALMPVIDLAATPDLVPKGAMVLQPSDERRRSGSHYTPRTLTEPIVRTTLEPILTRLRDVDGRPSQPEQILDLKVCDPAMGSGAFLVEACRQLGDALVESWHAYNEVPELPPDEDEVIFARRLIAQRCLYGVDRNPVAVDLAKVSLWLITLAKDHAFTFLDHALRHGDSLVGLTRKQIEAFHWKSDTPRFQQGFETMRVQERVKKFTDLRQRIREAGETISDRDLRDIWDQAQLELGKVRLFGDLVLAAFFDGENPKDREIHRNEFANAVVSRNAERYRERLDDLRHAEKPLVPFHWDIEFPEVFQRQNSGFDSIVGNPPFAGKNTTIGSNINRFPEWLKLIHEQSHGNSDLVAHFFRRAFGLLRLHGCLGFIATKTIREGDTRATGLRWICTHRGTIFHARRNIKWPGSAAVTVCTLAIANGDYAGPIMLDGRRVDFITAFLTYAGGHENPATLIANGGKSFVGSFPLGMGFTFDDKDTKGIANPIAEMRRLVTKDQRNTERIRPYIGGAEVNNSPTHVHHRFIIDFFDMPEIEARKWPDLITIVEKKVKPMRDTQKRAAVRQRWWQYAEKRPGLYESLIGLGRVLATVQTSKYRSFVFLPNGIVFDQKLIVFPLQAWSSLAVLQSRVHELWALAFGGFQGETPVYNPSDCFATFPFPNKWQIDPVIDAAGKLYDEFRAALMVRNEEGLTNTYNRFHDPEERDPELFKLRELHAAMDRTVLDAYGWTDIPIDCEFLLDYEIDEENWSPRKKKPWRYRWSEEVHDEVLARLLELNAKRAREEAKAGLGASGKGGKKPNKKTVRDPSAKYMKDMFS